MINGVTRTDRCPKFSKELLDTIIRNKQERPKLLSHISDNIYHNTDLWDQTERTKLESIYEANIFWSLENIFLLGFVIVFTSLITFLIYKLKKK